MTRSSALARRSSSRRGPSRRCGAAATARARLTRRRGARDQDQRQSGEARAPPPADAGTDGDASPAAPPLSADATDAESEAESAAAAAPAPAPAQPVRSVGEPRLPPVSGGAASEERPVIGNADDAHWVTTERRSCGGPTARISDVTAARRCCWICCCRSSSVGAAPTRRRRRAGDARRRRRAASTRACRSGQLQVCQHPGIGVACVADERPAPSQYCHHPTRRRLAGAAVASSRLWSAQPTATLARLNIANKMRAAAARHGGVARLELRVPLGVYARRPHTLPCRTPPRVAANYDAACFSRHAQRFECWLKVAARTRLWQPPQRANAPAAASAAVAAASSAAARSLSPAILRLWRIEW